MTQRRYGWKPDPRDPRDHVYKPGFGRCPTRVDLRPNMPEVYDQGTLNSCTANAIAGALEFLLHHQRLTDFTPSRLFIYYNTRKLEGTVHENVGTYIRDGIKTVNAQGVCQETMWSYQEPLFTWAPPDAAYQEAQLHQALQYQRVAQDVQHLKQCLAEGFPVVFGFLVTQDLESEQTRRTGELPMWVAPEEFLGGHAVLLVGYDDATQRFLVRNSWGPSWGVNGYFSMPYAYVTQPLLADDFWTIRLIEG